MWDKITGGRGGERGNNFPVPPPLSFLISSKNGGFVRSTGMTVLRPD